MPYWCAARIEANRERLATHCLQLNGYHTYAGLSADLRRQLTEVKIAPAAEGPASPPPLRQAEAPPARSTKNKRAQADK